MRIAGYTLSNEDIDTLYVLLNRTRRKTERQLASRIVSGQEQKLTSLTLAPAERDALLAVLDNPPSQPLSGVRDRLAENQLWRGQQKAAGAQ